VETALRNAGRRPSLFQLAVLLVHEQSIRSFRSLLAHCCCLAGLLLQLVRMLLVHCSFCLSTGQS
jgi:hypothetical protein